MSRTIQEWVQEWLIEVAERDNTINKLKEENARLREAIMSCLSGTDTTMSTFITLERALKAIKRGE